MTGVLNTTKVNDDEGPKYNKIIKAFLKGSKKTTETGAVILSNCCNKKETFILFYVKQVNKFVSYYQGQTPVFKRGFTY